MGIISVISIFALVSFSPAESTEELQATFACKGKLAFIVIDGKNLKIVESKQSTNISATYTFDPETQDQLFVRCRNSKHKPWILGSVSNGLVTDMRWKCFSILKEESRNLSGSKFFNDYSHWDQAVAHFSNNKGSPWGKVQDISSKAFWISTAEDNHSKLFCGSRLSGEVKSKEIFQVILDGVDYALSRSPRSQHEVSDVMQCSRKCRDDSQCLSFNFHYSSVLPTKTCELNGATKRHEPQNYVKRPGYTYYENLE